MVAGVTFVVGMDFKVGRGKAGKRAETKHMTRRLKLAHVASCGISLVERTHKVTYNRILLSSIVSFAYNRFYN